MINKLSPSLSSLSLSLTNNQTKKKRKANYECIEGNELFQGVFLTINSAVTVSMQ